MTAGLNGKKAEPMHKNDPPDDSVQRRAPFILGRRQFLSTLAASGGILAATRSGFGSLLQSGDLPAGVRPGDWPMIGADMHNTRFNPYERTIGPNNIDRLKVKWTFELAENHIQSTPVVVGDTVYFSSWDGHFYAVDSQTGKFRWKMDGWDLKPGEPAPDLRPPASPGEQRGSAFYENGRVYFGSGTGKVHCLDAATGEEIWGTPVDPEARKNVSHISASPLVYQGKVFIGVASGLGQIACLDAGTGAVRWRFYTVPGTPTGGGSVWTAAAIDREYNIVYNVIGNPKAFPPGPILFTESVLAHDLDSGELLWYHQLRPRDPFDLDFNTHPVLFDTSHPTHRGSTERHCIGTGNKSGGFHVFDRYTGTRYWNAMVTDNRTSINATAFAYNKIFLTSNSSGRNRIAGSVTVALHPYTGDVLWWTPNSSASGTTLAVANRVLYQGLTDGTLQALDVQTGDTLWTHQSPATRSGGLSVANGTLYTSIGATGRPPNVLYAFSIDGR